VIGVDDCGKEVFLGGMKKDALALATSAEAVHVGEEGRYLNSGSR
jgi:hypothetical protein